jgi:hypothetical protein
MKTHPHTRLGLLASLLAVLLGAFAIAASAAGALQRADAGYAGGAVSSGGGFGVGKTIAIAAPLGVLALFILYGTVRSRRRHPHLAVVSQLQEGTNQPETQREQQRKAA